MNQHQPEPTTLAAPVLPNKIEHVSRALYNARMNRCGIPGFEFPPYENLTPLAKGIADEIARVALKAALEWQRAQPSNAVR